MIARVMHRAAQSAEKRVDDNPEVFEKRIKTYLESTMPIVEVFQKDNKIIHLNAEKNKEEVILEFLHTEKDWKLV